MNSNQNAQQNAKAQGFVESPEWRSGEELRHIQSGKNVEFVTEFGVRHLGISVIIPYEVPDRISIQYGKGGSVVLKSEDTEHPEYFARHQVEKWRHTEERVPKKRFRGQTIPAYSEHSGVLTPLFLNYFQLRVKDRIGDPSVEATVYVGDTMHYDDVDGRQMWETNLGMSGHAGVVLIEYQISDEICVKFEEPVFKSQQESFYEKTYSFKDVARACEDLCRYFMDERKNR